MMNPKDFNEIMAMYDAIEDDIKIRRHGPQTPQEKKDMNKGSSFAQIMEEFQQSK